VCHTSATPLLDTIVLVTHEHIPSSHSISKNPVSLSLCARAREFELKGKVHSLSEAAYTHTRAKEVIPPNLIVAVTTTTVLKSKYKALYPSNRLKTRTKGNYQTPNTGEYLR
jgi:hypothetical protein